jgi:hypothetical protein
MMSVSLKEADELVNLLLDKGADINQPSKLLGVQLRGDIVLNVTGQTLVDRYYNRRQAGDILTDADSSSFHSLESKPRRGKALTYQ